MGDVDDGCVLMGVIVMINCGGGRESGSEEWHVWTMGVGDGCWRWVLAMGDNDVDEEVIMMDD